MKNVATTLTVTNEISIRGHAMLDLIKRYIQFADGFYGFRPTGSNPSIRYPVIFVEPRSEMADMNTTAKYNLHLTYMIYWYVRDADSGECADLSSFIGEALIKLFSNNALNDIGVVNPPTNNFRQYANPSGGYYWLEAVAKPFEMSVNYLDPEVSPALRYERAGRMQVELMDILLK